MAAIDKTYISSFEDYKKVLDWIGNRSITFKNGKAIKLIDYVYHPDITKEEWENQKKSYETRYPERKFEQILWNTPTYIDIWLIRNCPFDFIQNRLKEQYGKEYEEIKNHTSIYDTYQRNGLGKKSKVIFKGIKKNSWIRYKKSSWWIDVISDWCYLYNEDDDKWYDSREVMPWTSSCCHKSGTLTKKNVVNLIKRWNFPKGTIIRFSCRCGFVSCLQFECIVK